MAILTRDYVVPLLKMVARLVFGVEDPEVGLVVLVIICAHTTFPP